MMAIDGSILSSPEEQAVWLGQPSQDFDFPASLDLTPGQFSLASFGT